MNRVADTSFEVEFVESCDRIVGEVRHDITDYKFRVIRGDACRDIAVGIAGDWQDRLSAVEHRRIAETWLNHRLQHGYDPFREPQRHQQLLEVPFSVVEHWLTHRTLPH
jgi:hypothetical protein